MKRYLAFYGMEFYPNEGMDDFIGDFETHSEAISFIKKTNKEDNNGSMSSRWALVYDSENRIYVYKDGTYSE